VTYADIVGEQEILLRDWRAGVKALPIVLAKATVFGSICVLFAATMVVLFTGRRDGPPAAYSIPPAGGLLLAWLAVMLASMGLGLLISAVSPTLERAVTFSTILAVLQVVLNGALFKLPGYLWLPSLALPARLGFAAMASYEDVNRLAAGNTYTDSLWQVHPRADARPVVKADYQRDAAPRPAFPRSVVPHNQAAHQRYQAVGGAAPGVTRAAADRRRRRRWSPGRSRAGRLST
jgi:hypothetical protein